jgi:uncharacterized protein (TIGR02270 family)
MSARSPVQRPIGFKPSEISALINRPVIEQHAEEAAFLWTQRNRAALAPNYSLKDLAKLDGRVEAHVDGLRAAGEVGWEICVGTRQLGPGEAFAAAIMAFESVDERRVGPILETGSSEPVLERSVISALGWMSPQQATKLCARWLSVDSADLHRVGIAGFAVHRIDPGPELVRASLDENSRLRARALKAIGELGNIDMAGTLMSHLSDLDDRSRFYAAWSAARLGISSQAVIDVLREVAEGGGPDSERALDVAVRCMPLDQATAWRAKLSSRPEKLRLAVLAAGAIGDPEVMDELIQLTGDPKVARVAGGAVSMITGADLGYEDLDADAPALPAEGVSEEEEIAGPDADEGLDWPSPEGIARWWSKRSAAFQSGIRHLRGKPMSPVSLAETLVSGTQRQRAAAALEMAILNPGQVLFEVRERGDRQLERVKRWTS